MSDFFLELYSEEIPHGLQIHARKQIHELIFKELNQNNIKFKGFDVFSTPKRLIVFIENITLNQKIKAKDVLKKSFYLCYLIHKYFKKRYSILLQYKWPNDLFFNNKFDSFF